MSQKLASIAEPQKETPEKDEEFVLVPIHSVQVDALVALKIEKHAKENYPNSTTGALFGIDKDGVLEISNCSRFLNSFHADEDNQVHVQYQIEIMQQLRAVNFDSHTVGWYQASSLANFINLFWLNHQLDFQTSIPNSVVLEFVW
ncbi:hypothetical protein HMI54_012898 [Coelomomyces lativittatus]|nr:hypothetical protein HMI54_012898 [Coelomomyces lativittatus]